MADEKRGSGGSGTAGRGIENEGTGSLRVPQQKDHEGNVDASTEHERAEEQQGGSGSTKGGREPGVSGKRGVTGGTEKEGEGHSGPIRSGQKRPETDQDRAEGGAREGYEDHGGSREEDGTQGESSGSRPGYR